MENNINNNSVKVERQIFLLKNKIKSIKKEIYNLYELYLKVIRSKIVNDISKSIHSLIDLSLNQNYKNNNEIKSLIDNIVLSQVNNFLPFLTIEQLTILNNFDKKNISESDDVLQKKSLENNIIYEQLEHQNEALSLNDYSYGYYDFLAIDSTKKTINLDDKEINLINLEVDSLKKNKAKIERQLTLSDYNFDFKEGNVNNTLNVQLNCDNNLFMPDESFNIIRWIDSIDYSLDSQLNILSTVLNLELQKNGILNNFITEELINYLLSNNFLLLNPRPFIVLFDLSKSQINDFYTFPEDIDISRIYLFNINRIEIEFNHLDINIIRNKILDLKTKLKFLVKKEKYWYGKKNISTYNS